MDLKTHTHMDMHTYIYMNDMKIQRGLWDKRMGPAWEREGKKKWLQGKKIKVSSLFSDM